MKILMLAALLAILYCPGDLWAQDPMSAGKSNGTHNQLRKSWTIDGQERKALVFLPGEGELARAPVVFGFHGHGGNAGKAASQFRFQKYWPEAIVIYMQGVPTPGRLSDKEGKKSGWQHEASAFDGRDLKFFDAVLSTLRENYSIDAQRVYASGHSNGGGFSYLLWTSRPGVLAAIAPSAASSGSLLQTEPQPIPVMHIAGRNDPVVKYEWQKATMRRVCEINYCGREGVPWAEVCLSFSSENMPPLVTCTHEGTHKYPKIASELIVRFFKEHRKSP